MTKNKSAIITCALIALLLTLTVSCWGLSKKDLSEMQNTVSDMNKGLPMMTSSEMQLTRVYMRYNTIVYVLKSFAYNAKQISPQNLENNLKPTAARGLCSAPDSSSMLKKGLTYAYVFYGNDDKYAHEYSITAKDCE